MICQNEIIDSVLNTYKTDLGNYFTAYRNHVYRVYNFALTTMLTDNEKNKMAIAAAFHDIGIWTNYTFDYLEPSIVLANQFCADHNFSNEDTLEIAQIINDHHQLNEVKSSKLAEIFRQADLIDLSLGMIKKGRKTDYIATVRKKWPNEGFHLFLLKTFFSNLLKHPFNPIPVLKF